MHVIIHLLLIAVCGLAESSRDKGSKVPFVADAVGNALPPPSKVPAPVGSPVNLLTPDRYEFYTFDESGELVKRLMTLEEIQAIVAAGEEGDSMVTFANDDQPTVAFNFSQPPSTKVHSVVTNVQNVLKAQMEAHKNKPLFPPTLDTPDVSDSWSLILPSIFGNTGVDIIPDKSSASFTTPETETLEINSDSYIEDNSLSKEGNEQMSIMPISSTETYDITEKSIIEEIKEELTKTSTLPEKLITTVTPPTTAFESLNPVTLESEKSDVSTFKTTPTVLSTTEKPRTTATVKSYPTTITSTITTTVKPTTIKIAPSTSLMTTTTSTTTQKPELSTKKYIISTESSTNKNGNVNAEIVTNNENDTIFEKISTFIPVSTVEYLTERTSQVPSTTKVIALTTKEASTTSVATSTPSSPKTVITTPSYVSSTTKKSDSEKDNITTITTQSVSPSTTISSTKVVTVEDSDLYNNFMDNKPAINQDTKSEIVDNEPVIPMFDVAQSISQIASDLGGDFQPIPTVSNLLDTTKIDENFESKENVEVEIPMVVEFDAKNKTNNDSINEDNFVKISTLDPHPAKEEENAHIIDVIEPNKIEIESEQAIDIETTTVLTESTTIDPILNESMEDLISQVVNEIPQQIINPESSSKITTTEQITETTTENKYNIEIDSEISDDEETVSTTETLLVDERMTTISSNDITTEVTTVINNIKESEWTNSSDIKNYNLSNDVEIPMSNKNDLENSTTAVYHDTFITSTPKIDKDKENTKDKEITTVFNKDELSNLDNNEIPKIATTTAKIKVSTEASTSGIMKDVSGIEKISSQNKFSSNKKEANIHRKDTVQELSLKIDEFKKKIQKVNIAEEELLNSRNNSWKLIPTVTPSKEKVKTESHHTPDHEDKDIVLEFSKENQGLEVTTKDLSEDITQFTELCNELAFRYWNVMTEKVDKKRSFVLSPYSITSMLAMMFMGARGATSGEMNEILKLDDMVTFNPHFTLKNISDSIDLHQGSGIVVSAFIRELYSDRNKGKILTFYKERAQQFYNGHVEEINFKLISDIIRRRTNLLVKRYTYGKIPEFMKTNSIVMQPPLAAFSTNIFETDCTGSSVGGRDGEMYFVVSPNVRQRRLVPVPAVVYKQGFLAGYDPVLDATAAALGDTNSIISTLFLMPGQQGNVVHAEDLEKLEHRLLEAEPTTPAWNRLLRTLLPRVGLELQIPRFSHKSVFNVSSSLRKMGLKDLFDAEHADLGGLNGPSKDLFLSDMVQMTTFVTCGEDIIGDQHHVEEYPESLPSQRRRTSRWAHYWDEPRDYQRAFHDPHDLSEAMNLPLHLRPRQARVPARNVQPARLKFDRPFLFFTRHNPTGMILYVGRYNPRLLP